MPSNVSLDTFEEIDDYRMRLLLEQADLIHEANSGDHKTRVLSDGVAMEYWKLGEKIRLLECIDRIRRDVDS